MRRAIGLSSPPSLLRGCLAALALALGLTLTPSASAQSASPRPVVFVRADAPSGGDGGSWERALSSLDQALAQHPGASIWIARGSYRPSSAGSALDDGTARSWTFEVPAATSLHGGFRGNESSLEERPLPITGTVLSGDLPETPTNARGDDCFSVVTIAPGADAVVLDGLEIRDGWAMEIQHPDGRSRGAGISAASVGRLLLSDCTVTDNRAARAGAGLDFLGSQLLVRQCTFEGNLVGGNVAAGTWAHGGGACITVSRGAAPSRIHSTVFRNNIVSAELGGSGQQQQRGGGLYFGDLQTGLGAFGATSDASLELANCVFILNLAPQGGAVAVQASAPVAGVQLRGCTLVRNVAVNLYPAWSGNGNALSFEYGGVENALWNTVAWNNLGSPQTVPIHVRSGPPILAEHSNLQPQATAAWVSNTGTVLQLDPLFVDLAGEDVRLQATSPLLDLGSNAAVPRDALDLDRDGWRWERLPWSIVPGEPRIAPSTPQAPPIVDLGAFERS